MLHSITCSPIDPELSVIMDYEFVVSWKQWFEVKNVLIFNFALTTVWTLLLIALRLLPIFVLFSDLSKILTSADQHSAQTTNFFGKRRLFTSSLHSGDGKIQLSTFEQTRENASSGIYLLHELPQTFTKDFQNRRNTQQMVITDPLSIQPVSPVNLVNPNSLYQV